MSWKKPTAGIILAAGESVRFGQTKQLLKIKNKYLIEWVLEASLNSHLDQVILVLGHEHQKILHALGKKIKHPRLQVVVNPNYKQGQSLSLRVGFEKIRDEFQSVMFLLADQPMVDKKTINDLLEKFWASNKDICVPIYRGNRGNPTIFGKRLYDQLSQVEGDVGAREIIQSHPDLVLQVVIDNPLFFFDVDTPDDFSKLNSLMS